MKWHSISEVAEIVNLSRQAVYKKLNRLSKEEKATLNKHIDSTGQTKLSDKAILLIFGVSTSVNQCDNQVYSEVDTSVNQRVVTGLQKQLEDREKEVDRLSDILDNFCKQLEEERRLRGEERQRTDTILMKMTNDISEMRKALEYKSKDEPDVRLLTSQHEKEKDALISEIEESRKETGDLRRKMFGIETRQNLEAAKLKEGQETLIKYLQELRAKTNDMSRPWYSKFWSWLSRPITLNGKEISIEIEGDEKNGSVELTNITEARAA